MVGPEWSELVSVVGPTGAVILWIYLTERQRKAEPPKEDAAAKVAEEIRLLRAEVAAHRSESATGRAEIQSELSKLSGFLAGRLK